MKAKIQKYKVSARIKAGTADIVNVETVLARHIRREFKDRHKLWMIKPLIRMDIRDAVKALRTMRGATMEINHVG
jgi:hypothetical protein